MDLTKDNLERAAKFYERQPTGQYDDEAQHALECHLTLVEALDQLVLMSVEAAKWHLHTFGSSVHPDLTTALAALAKARRQLQ